MVMDEATLNVLMNPCAQKVAVCAATKIAVGTKDKNYLPYIAMALQRIGKMDFLDLIVERLGPEFPMVG